MINVMINETLHRALMRNRYLRIILALTAFGAADIPSYSSDTCVPEQVITRVKSVDLEFLDDLLYLLLDRLLHDKSQHVSVSDPEVSLENLDGAYLWKKMPSPDLLRLYQLCRPPKGHSLISMDARDEALKIASKLDQPWHDAFLSILGPNIIGSSSESEDMIKLIQAIKLIKNDNYAASKLFDGLNLKPKFRSLALYGEALALNGLGKPHDALSKFALSRRTGLASAVRLLNEGLVAKRVSDYERASQCFLAAAQLVPSGDTTRQADLHAEMMICDRIMGRKQPTVLQFPSGYSRL